MTGKVTLAAELPHRDKDAVLVLYVHYFQAADLMLKSYKTLSAKWDAKDRLSQGERSKFSIYFCTWLGLLAVTAEGFKKLRIRKLLREARPHEFSTLVSQVDGLRQHLHVHDEALRKFRNSVFHLRDSAEDLQRFFDLRPNRLRWAEELHAEFQEFFSGYRVLCEVRYIIEKRRDESMMQSRRNRREAT